MVRHEKIVDPFFLYQMGWIQTFHPTFSLKDIHFFKLSYMGQGGLVRHRFDNLEQGEDGT
jgi:hypothetical protein